MHKKHFISIILLFLFILSISAGPAFAEDRSYSIPNINMDIFPQADGTLHVKETIHYSFSGTYNGINRYIPINGNQELQNVKVSTQGAYSNFNVIDNGNQKQIKVYLYDNPQKSVPITDKDVEVTFEYDFIHAIKFYNDIAELQYKLVGEGWSVDIGQLNAIVHFKSSDGVKYWLNPPYYAQNSSWNGNDLQISSKNIPSGDFFELRSLIPKNQFAANPVNGIIINQNGLNQIEAIQNDYQNQINIKTSFYSIWAIILILLCSVPLIIYLKFGREPKIDYQAEYERDIPTDDPPAIVNAICGPGFSKKIGTPDMDGFKATIMDLINSKYLLLKNEPSGKEDLGLSASISMKVNQNKNSSKLKDFELDVLNFLQGYEEAGIISMDNISMSLSDRSNAMEFKNTFNSWKNNIKRNLDGSEMNKIFIKKGDTYLKAFGGLGLVVAVITFFFTVSDPIPAASFALLASIVLGLASIISLALPEKVGGRWTTYGEEYDAKWHNFKKYIKDFSLIKEYPPESIAIWNKYLVYAPLVLQMQLKKQWNCIFQKTSLMVVISTCSITMEVMHCYLPHLTLE